MFYDGNTVKCIAIFAGDTKDNLRRRWRKLIIDSTSVQCWSGSLMRTFTCANRNVRRGWLKKPRHRWRCSCETLAPPCGHSGNSFAKFTLPLSRKWNVKKRRRHLTLPKIYDSRWCAHEARCFTDSQTFCIMQWRRWESISKYFRMTNSSLLGIFVLVFIFCSWSSLPLIFLSPTESVKMIFPVYERESGMVREEKAH